MKARHKAAKGTKYSYEDHYEDDVDFMESYDDSLTASQEGHMYHGGNQDYSMSMEDAIPEEDEDILNDCLDQIYSFFDDQVNFDEDSIVELLRSNYYNVEEAIDYIMEHGESNNQVNKPILGTKIITSKPAYTIPKDTLASIIGKSTKEPQDLHETSTQSIFTIEKDILPNVKRFDFASLSPDEYIKKMQDEGKTRCQNARERISNDTNSIKMPVMAESLVGKKIVAEKSPKSPQSPKSPNYELDLSQSPVEEQEEPQVVKSPQALIEGKDMITVVIAGHVDHGKSTITGHLMYELNVVSDKELRKVSKEAKDLGKQSFNYAFIMDQNPEEREHGVTIDLGVMNIQTEHRYITLLDAPGHRDFVSAMITGGVQADCALLVVSAQKGEFEAGISSGGITKEHLLILNGCGIENVIVVINKMDTCNYAEARYTEIVNSLIPYFKHLGFKRKNVTFIPASGLEGVNLINVDTVKCPWYKGKSLIDCLDIIQKPLPDETLQHTNDVVMMIADAYHEDYTGDCVAAKIARGFIDLNHLKPMVFLPSKSPVNVKSLLVNNAKTNVATMNTNVVLGLTNADLTTISKGNLITTTNCQLVPSNRIVAQIYVNENSGKVVMKGLPVLIHMAGNMMSGVLKHLIALVDCNGKELQKKPKLVRGEQWVLAELALDHEMYVAPVTKIPILGRFILREDGQTLGIGKIIEVKKSKFHRI